MKNFSASEKFGAFLEKNLANEKGDKSETDLKEKETENLLSLAIDLKFMAGNAEQRLEATRKALQRYREYIRKMKTAVRTGARGKREIKASLAALTDANSLLPEKRAEWFKERKLGQEFDRYAGWSVGAYDSTASDEWLVIKVPKANRTHFMCDFCDGDKLDEYEWLEGNFKQDLTVRELLEYRRGRIMCSLAVYCYSSTAVH